MKTWAPLIAVLLAACAPAYVDREGGSGEAGVLTPTVFFHLHGSYREAPPDCVAVLPLAPPSEDDTLKAESVRRAFYAHLAPQGKREVELARVDHVLAALSPEDKGDLGRLGQRLRCAALVTGRVTEHSSRFFGVYSRVAVGADLRMVRAADGALLWEGRHVAESHGGSLPLSPIGLAMGVLDAATNVNEEQTLRVIDDLARRLVSTIPDDSIAALEDPVAPASPVRAVAVPVPPPPADRLGSAEARLAAGDYAAALAEADAAIAAERANPQAYFLRARVLIRQGDLDQADPALIRALALQPSNPRFLDALGYLSSVRGQMDRALAAYRMAIDADPSDGFAWYNSGVIFFNQGDLSEAADAFYGAGLAYMKGGNYGQAGKALADLRDLAAQGIDRGREIGVLEGALADLSPKGRVP